MSKKINPELFPKFVGAFVLNPSQAWEGYRDTLFKEHVKDMPDHIDQALNLAFLVGLSHGAMLQGQLADSCNEFVNAQISEILSKD